MNQVIDIVLWIIYSLLLYVNIFWLLVYFFNSGIDDKKGIIRGWPKVTLVIHAHNEEEVIALTLKSAINIDYPRDKLEIIVASNASTDNTVKIAQDIKNNNKKTDIKILDLKKKGKGLALNNALSIAKGEFFVLFDADSFVESSALKTLLPYFYSNQEVACVLPMMKVGKAKNFLQKLQWYEYIMNLFYKRLMAILDSVHVAPGPFSIYRTQILKKIGGFSYPNLTEDLEITLRLQKHNYKIIQTIDAEVRTIVPNNINDLARQRNRWYKGTVHNALSKDYLKMWFNKKYGDFGLIQMPILVVPGLFAIIILLVHLYYLFKNIWTTFFNLYNINFDVLTLIRNFTFDFNILDAQYTRMVIASIMLFTGILTFYLSHRMTNEKVFRYGKLPVIVFLFTFPFFLSYIWTKILIEVTINNVQEW